MSPAGLIKLTLPVHASTGDFAVGDWVLVDPQTHVPSRRLGRKSVMERHVEGAKAPQLFAANVDTLFIVTSCNADFNPARLERYLALANQAGTNPVILLTKVDANDDRPIDKRPQPCNATWRSSLCRLIPSTPRRH